MNAENLLDACQPIIKRIAAKYSIKGNVLITAEDLEQEQVAKVLEIAANQPPHESDDHLIRYTLTACRKTCLCLIRDDWRKAGRTVAQNVDDYIVASFISDGTYEKLRLQVEQQERAILLRSIAPKLRRKYEHKVLQEIISPGTVTRTMLESGATPKEALAAGAGVSWHLVRKSLTEIRKAMQHAA